MSGCGGVALRGAVDPVVGSSSPPSADFFVCRFLISDNEIEIKLPEVAHNYQGELLSAIFYKVMYQRNVNMSISLKVKDIKKG